MVGSIAPQSNDARMAGVVSRLDSGARIRVVTSDRRVFNGRYVRLENESLSLFSAARRDASTIPLAQLDTLWVRGRDHRRGVFLGALIGGVLGAGGVALVAHNITKGTSEHCNCTKAVERTVEVSLSAGGVIGGVIGVPAWLRRWPP
jgi:hypothetical protein